MKIQVKDLKHNPHRDLSKYPIDREKVESLKSSINETGFWDNILVRKYNGGYELSYGHHRLIALTELNIKEVDVPVKDLDDATMLKIMANENLDQWQSNPAVVIETVRAAKNFLDSELAGHDYKDSAKFSIVLFKSEHAYNQAKQKPGGVGRKIILSFLGEPWKPWMVEDALKIINDESLDQEVVKDFTSLASVSTFQDEVKRHEVPKSEQRKLSQAIQPKNEEKSIPRRDIRDAVENIIINEKFPSKKKESRKTEKIKEFGIFIAEVRNAADDFTDKLKDLNKLTDELGVESFSGNIQSKLLTLSLNNIENQLTTFKSKF